MSKKKFFESTAFIRDIDGEENCLCVMIDDPEFHEQEDSIKIPLRLLEQFHQYIGERIDYLKQHGLIAEEKKGGGV